MPEELPQLFSTKVAIAAICSLESAGANSVVFGVAVTQTPSCADTTTYDSPYFGSYTVYHLELPSGRTLKVSQNNTQRHREHELTWGSEAWAHWSRQSQVVLTQ